MEYLSLISDYENLLLGQIDKLPKVYFSKNNKTQNEKNMMYLYKYLIEDIYKWTPQEAKHLLNWNILKLFKLSDLTNKYFEFVPGMMKKEMCEYIVHKCYPNEIHYDIYLTTIHTYENILQNKTEKWAKKYFSATGTEEGYIRACICMNYILSKYFNDVDIENLYKLFSCQAKANKILSKYKIKKACDDLFYHPIDYLHYSLKEKSRSDFLYNYYRFVDMYLLVDKKLKKQ